MPEHLFSATTFAVGHISNILRSILSVNSNVLVSIDSEGIRFMTEYSHICRMDLTLEKSLFTTFSYNSDQQTPSQASFTVDLTPIVESLSLAQSNAPFANGSNGAVVSAVQCTISYARENSPFVLIFEDSKISERCEFSTFLNVELAHLLRQNSMGVEDEDEDDMRDGFDIDQNAIQLECIVKSDVFFDALKDLKDLETEDVYFYFAQTLQNRNDTNDNAGRIFSIVSKSAMGNSLLSLPNEITILEKLKINAKSDRRSYRHQHNNDNTTDFCLAVFKFNILQMCFKAIRLSNKCKIQKNFNSLLNLNLLCFRNDSRSVLPKSYTGTVINFKIFESLNERDGLETVKEFIDKSLHATQSGQTVTAAATTTNSVTVEPPQIIIKDSCIDVPIFL